MRFDGVSKEKLNGGESSSGMRSFDVGAGGVRVAAFDAGLL